MPARQPGHPAMTTAYFTHPDCRRHDMGAGHPECPQRLDAIEDHLLATGLDIALTRMEPPLAEHGDLMLAHSEGYLLELEEFMRQAPEFEAWLTRMGVLDAAGRSARADLHGVVRMEEVVARARLDAAQQSGEAEQATNRGHT